MRPWCFICCVAWFCGLVASAASLGLDSLSDGGETKRVDDGEKESAVEFVQVHDLTGYGGGYDEGYGNEPNPSPTGSGSGSSSSGSCSNAVAATSSGACSIDFGAYQDVLQIAPGCLSGSTQQEDKTSNELIADKYQAFAVVPQLIGCQLKFPVCNTSTFGDQGARIFSNPYGGHPFGVDQDWYWSGVNHQGCTVCPQGFYPFQHFLGPLSEQQVDFGTGLNTYRGMLSCVKVPTDSRGRPRSTCTPYSLASDSSEASGGAPRSCIILGVMRADPLLVGIKSPTTESTLELTIGCSLYKRAVCVSVNTPDGSSTRHCAVVKEAKFIYADTCMGERTFLDGGSIEECIQSEENYEVQDFTPAVIFADPSNHCLTSCVVESDFSPITSGTVNGFHYDMDINGTVTKGGVTYTNVPNPDAYDCDQPACTTANLNPVPLVITGPATHEPANGLYEWADTAHMVHQYTQSAAAKQNFEQYAQNYGLCSGTIQKY